MRRICGQFAVLWTTAAFALGASAGVFDRGESRPADAGVAIPVGDPLTEELALSPLERQLFADAVEGSLDEFAVLDAALVACGDENSLTIDRCRKTFDAVCSEVRQSAVSALTTLDLAEIIHRTLHQRLLGGGYDANATDLAETLRSGTYNCASATVLWIALARELKLEVHAVEMPGHVRVVVQCDGQFEEIEATCPRWPEAMRSISPLSPGVRAGGTRPERAITSSGLLAMIYYNRGIDAFNDRQYADAVALNRGALRLDPDNQTARGNLLASINNWALALGDIGQFDAAERLLAAGRNFDPNHAAFAHNAAHIQQQRLQTQLIPAARAGE
jgi:tetratricopeptide (TPR) repeat protein